MTETIKITSKIVSQRIDKSEINIEKQNEKPSGLVPSQKILGRPDVLYGATYKLKSVNQKPIYITINDYKINEGTPEERLIPFEIFHDSRNVDNHEWVTSLFTTMSALFRTGIDISFHVEDLKNTPSNSGGYFVPGKKGLRVLGVVSHIGYILEEHLISTGYIKKDIVVTKNTETKKIDTVNKYLCSKCNQIAVIRDGGCEQCTNCGDSKCG